jgi:hypothetical protein
MISCSVKCLNIGQAENIIRVAKAAGLEVPGVG